MTLGKYMTSGSKRPWFTRWLWTIASLSVPQHLYSNAKIKRDLLSKVYHADYCSHEHNRCSASPNNIRRLIRPTITEHFVCAGLYFNHVSYIISVISQHNPFNRLAKYLFSTFLGARDIEVNKTDKCPCSGETYIPVRKTENKQDK